jgi:hypothetical protein
VLVLFATLLFVFNAGDRTAPSSFAVQSPRPAEQRLPQPEHNGLQGTTPQAQTAVAGTIAKENKSHRAAERAVPAAERKEMLPVFGEAVKEDVQTAALHKADPVLINATTLPDQPSAALNKLLANSDVTTATPVAYNQQEDPDGTAVTDGDYKGSKKSSAKGFLRKVSRFIERRTGIGTVNSDNEILVGAVALKLN